MKYLQGEQLSLIADVEELPRPIGDWYDPADDLGSISVMLPNRTPSIVDRTPSIVDRTPSIALAIYEVEPKVREHNSIDALMLPNRSKYRRNRPGKNLMLPNSDLKVPFGTIEFKVIKENAYYYWRYRVGDRQRSIYLGHGKPAVDRLSTAIAQAENDR